MLRIEQGLDPSLFETSDLSLSGYAQHHRPLVRGLAAYDVNSSLLHDGPRHPISPIDKFQQVKDGLIRSATLSLALDDVGNADTLPEWIATRDYLEPENVHSNPWRVEREPQDAHMYYLRKGIWTATRTIAQTDETRVRERYTIAGNTVDVEKQDIVEMIDKGISDKDLIIATATVYALNKAVKKLEPELPEVDWSKFPTLNAMRHR